MPTTNGSRHEGKGGGFGVLSDDHEGTGGGNSL
jgi:hypothetical protein